jgi:hypothetical protein
VAGRRLSAAVVAGLLVLVPACSKDKPTARPGPTSVGERSTSTAPEPDRPRGGTARVGVWGAPDVAAPTTAGSAVRALVLPQLFVAQPDGTWRPSLVTPGSDRLAADALSASFRLRPKVAWSDGSPITVDDLRRSADGRFVAGIDGPDAKGAITVRFTSPQPGWRRLWSGRDAVTAPKPGVWGGPFVVAAATPGLETVLRRNDRWSGVVGKGPFLDELRLVLVPDSLTARQLLAKGELDVVMSPAFTQRTPQLEAVDKVHVDAVERGGWWVGMFFSDKLGQGQRLALAGTVDRSRFISVLLQHEARVLDGFVDPEDGTWANAHGGDVGGVRGRTGIDMVGQIEEPMTTYLQRVIQQRIKSVGASLDLRNAEADRVEPWLAEGAYAAAIAMTVDGPEVCWVCRWSKVDEALARAADAGDGAAAAALEAKLRDQGWLLPLWRPRTVVAWRDGLSGVRANGYALNAAWNAWEWWRGS